MTVDRDPGELIPRQLAEKIRATRGFVEGERKQVTVMFVDVVHSMDLSESLGAERWRALVERLFVTASHAVHRVEGTIHQFTGDGVLALFGAPLAHEDHAQRACLAALQLHAQLASDTQASDGVTLAIRVGLNSGEVIVGDIGDAGQMEYTAIGHTMGLAQRMESLAPPGSTAVSESTARLVEGEFVLRDMGAFEIKGASEPRRVFELVGSKAGDRLAAADARGGLSPFVGRQRECSLLEAALERALAGDGGTVGIVGEPGVGKSRLAHEFAQRCVRGGLAVQRTRAVAHGRGVPLLPVLDLMRTTLGIADVDRSELARARIARRLVTLDASFEADLSLIFDFLGVADPDDPAPKLDPDARQRRLLSVVHRLVRARSSVEPAVIVIEDLHWLDDASAAFLAELVRATAGTRTLLLLTYRPEYRGEALRGSDCAQLVLRPLGPSSVARLLTSLLGDDRSLDGLQEVIAARAVGNPFFCEELVAALAEAGYLSGEPGAYRLGRTVEGVVLPASVQATLAARIDRLSERDKGLLQVAAVIGGELPEPLLRAVAAPAEQELTDALESLLSAGFVMRRTHESGVAYAFKHPLIQEVAYHAQLTERRRQLHARVSAAIEQLSGDRLDEHAALIAHHAEAAGETLAAAGWSARAAAWVGLSDMRQAVAHWRKVAELADAITESREAERLSRLAHVRQLDYGWRLGMSDVEAAEHYERARRILERRGGGPRLVGLTSLYATVRGLGGHLDDYEALSEEADRRSKAIGDPTLRVGTLIVTMQARLSRGRIAGAIDAAEEAIAILAENPLLGSRESSVVCPYAWCLMFRGWILCDAGRLDEAADTLRQALVAAEQHADLETQGWAHMLYVLLARHTGAAETMLAHATEAREIGERTGAAFSRAWQMYFLGYARLMAGQTSEAIEAIERSITIARESGTALEQEPVRIASLSEALRRAGDIARALETAREAVAIAVQRGNAGNLPYCYRVLAEALLDSDEPDRIAGAQDALAHAQAAADATGARAELPHIERARARLVPVS